MQKKPLRIILKQRRQIKWSNFKWFLSSLLRKEPCGYCRYNGYSDDPNDMCYFCNRKMVKQIEGR